MLASSALISLSLPPNWYAKVQVTQDISLHIVILLHPAFNSGRTQVTDHRSPRRARSLKMHDLKLKRCTVRVLVCSTSNYTEMRKPMAMA